MTTLMKANYEWARRPNDEKYSSLIDLHQSAVDSFESHKAIVAPFNSIRVEARDGNMELVGRAGIPATFTSWSFGQLCQRVNAPQAYLSELPATLAAQNINHGLAVKADSVPAQLYFHNGNSLRLHGLNSERYSRIFDRDITSRLLQLVERNPSWQPAPAAFDGSRGLYRGVQDMFAFLVDNNRRIFETDRNGGLSRGFFVWNSEVGAASFGVQTFLYEYVCGNHRVWGATNVQELRIRHVGDANDRAFGELTVELRKYAESSATDIEAKIISAKRAVIATDKDKLLDAIFGKRIPALSRSMISKGFDKAVEHSDWYGNPYSVWGLSGGLTELARDLPNADERIAVDRAAGKILDFTF